jgi:uncharacterized protein YndB with AHSA1/START domain
MTIQDNIEREMILKADIAVVWDAITHPEQLSKWFGDRADIPTLKEGEPITFGWGDDLCKGVIQTIDEPTVFAFRWQSSRLGQSASYQSDYATLVTFTLTPVPTGTHLHLIETGFANLPTTIDETVAVLSSDAKVPSELSTGGKLPHNEQAYEDNVSGWTYELDELRTFVEQSV